MFRQSLVIATSLVTALGFIRQVPAQTAPGRSPSTAYRQEGKWVGYVPPHQRYAQKRESSVFPASLPDVTSFLSGKRDDRVKAASAVEPVEEPPSPVEGALLESEEPENEPRVLAVAHEQPAPTYDPAADGEPVFDPAAEMIGSEFFGTCEPCPAEPATCCPPPRFYGQADYLLWWTDDMSTPPLVTTSPAGTVQDQAGVLGQPGTSILFGGSGLDGGSTSGGRFTLGMWLDPCQSQGVEASYFTLGTETSSFAASNADYPILARPFFNVVDGEEDARLIVFDDLVSGSVDVTASTRFEGGEILFRQTTQRDCWADIDLLIGYRWLQLEDDLLIEEATQSLSAAAPSTSINLFDRFDTRNSFHGPEVGLTVHRRITPCWSLEMLAKVGVGNVNSVATVDGERVTVAPTGTSVTEGGLLALPSNIGRYERDKLATATELGLKLRREFLCGIDVTVGYTFLHLSEVVRAGDQIDTNINQSQIPPDTLDGAPLPEFDFRSTGFWAQGLSLGIEGCF